MDLLTSMSLIAMVTACVSVGYSIILAIMRHSTQEDISLMDTVSNIAKHGAVLLPSFIIRVDHSMENVLFIYYVVSFSASVNNMMKTYAKYVSGHRPKAVDVTGKVYIVTGSNTGIGFQTALSILTMGGTVILACRSPGKAAEARDDLIRRTRCSETKVIFLALDLCNYGSVREFVKAFKALKLPLHCLINNAGVMMPDREENKDGHEIMMCANHLSHFLLTNLLLPALEKTGLPKEFNFDDMMSLKSYSLFGTYGQTKLANILFMRQLHMRLTAKGSKVTSHAVHPGVVRTEVSRNLPWIVRTLQDLAYPIMAVIQKTPEQGAYSSVYCATSPTLGSTVTGEVIGGTCYFHCKEYWLNPAGLDEAAAARLWKESTKLTGL